MENQKNQEQLGFINSYLDWSDKNKHGILRYSLGIILCIFSLFVLNGIGTIPFILLDPLIKNFPFKPNMFMLSSFLVPFIMIPIINHWVHKRPFWSVIMPKFKFEKWNLFFGFIISPIVGLLVTFVFKSFGLLKLNFIGFDWKVFLPSFLIGIIGIFIQAGAEEFFFRGYLTQFTRRISKNPIVFIMIPALCFAYPHIGNVASYGYSLLAMQPYLILGTLLGWVAYKTGSLWMSLGIHWGNNLSGMFFIGLKEDVLKTVAPFKLDLPSLEMVSLIILIQSILISLFVLFYLKKTIPSKI